MRLHKSAGSSEHLLAIQSAKALMRLHKCTGSSEHLLVANGISMINLCVNSFDFTGVLYAAFCNNENSAIQLSLGSFFPLLLLSGK